MIREWLRQLRIDIEPYHLPQEVEEQCFRYLSSLGLQYGCIDMMVTPEDEYVFWRLTPMVSGGLLKRELDYRSVRR